MGDEWVGRRAVVKIVKIVKMIVDDYCFYWGLTFAIWEW